MTPTPWRRSAAWLCAVVAIIFSMLPPPVQAASDYARTRYPIVLVHGLTGAEKMGGVLDYWYGIPELLRANGATVYVATVPAFNSDEARALQLAEYVRSVKLATGADKVNLIGHSQGGPTSRVLAAMSPQDVASVTTIGSPHRGSEFADLVLDVINGVNQVPVVGSVLVGLVADVANAVGWFQGISNGVGNGAAIDQDALASLKILTTRAAAAQNARLDATLKPGTPSALGANCATAGAAMEQRQARDASGNLVTYTQAAYSWTGRGGAIDLFRSNLLDPTTALMAATGGLMSLKGSGPNDGLVSVCSSQWGRVLATNYYWNHLDEVNQIAGLFQDVDPRTAILQHANRLRNDRL